VVLNFHVRDICSKTQIWTVRLRLLDLCLRGQHIFFWYGFGEP
jgi:hypothetical protein